MRFIETKLKGAYVIELEQKTDERGYFTREFCQKEFETHGLNTNIAQCNISYSKRNGTLRGLHFQYHPYEEVKVLLCLSGSLYDVIVDLRPQSPTFKQWNGVVLKSETRQLLYIPKGFAHGFLTLEDNTEAFYHVSEFYNPEHEGGVRWNDPAFNIIWPIQPTVISQRDKTFADFKC